MLYFPAITSAAAIRTTFLMMYCPTNDGSNGKTVKQVAFTINIGKKVTIICNKSKKIVIGIKRFISNPTPIMISQIPKIGINISGLNQ